MTHTLPRNQKQIQDKYDAKDNFDYLCSEKWDKLSHKCRYCDKYVKKSDVFKIYDPQFNEIVHLNCLRNVRENDFTILCTINLVGGVSKEEQISDYKVWDISRW